MPSTYAHYRMGKELIKALPESRQTIIRNNMELYLIGLHGPDILFYYKPLKRNHVNSVGYGMHERSGREFFENAAKVIKAHHGDSAYKAYVYGVICHFSLDVMCHGYIDEKIQASGVSHAEIEVEFDRMLMLLDHLDPVRHVLTGHIVPSDYNSSVIHCFYNGIERREVKKALGGMIYNNSLLLAPSRIKRTLIDLLLLVSGNYKEMHGLIVNYRKNSKCEDSNRQLMQLYKKAGKKAVMLIEEYDGYLDGTHPLNPIYNYTFGSKPGEACTDAPAGKKEGYKDAV